MSKAAQQATRNHVARSVSHPEPKKVLTPKRKAVAALVTAAALVALAASPAWAPVGAKRKARVEHIAQRP